MGCLYLSGPMSGLPDFNFPAFRDAAKALRDAGATVVSPAEFGTSPNRGWYDYLKRDLTIMFQCDGVVTLDGWQDSKGACLEVTVARQLGMLVISYEELMASLCSRSPSS